ncbi:MAG: EamA family transporter [Planctomycetes bacterium]|nr:EamA family transporter [Planctomycetota bacterium]
MTNLSESSSGLVHGRILLISAAIMWSTSGLFLKSPLMEELPLDSRGPVVACYRALFAAAVLIPFVRFGSIRWKPALVPMTILFAVMNLLFVTAMTRTTAAATIFLQYTSTAWAFLFGLLFLKERVERGNLVALAFSLCGIVWIVAGDWGGENFTGNLLALGSGFCYAGVVLSLRVLRDEDSAWLVTLNNLIGGLVLLPWAFSADISLRSEQWLLVALLGAFQLGVPYVLFARGIRSIRIQEAALLSLMEPVLNPVWVLFVWKRSPEPTTWIGGALILTGLAVRYLLFPSREPSQRETV